MWAEPGDSYSFVFLRFTDDLYSVNVSASAPYLSVGGGDREKYGSAEDNALWAADGLSRDACDGVLLRWGLATRWEYRSLELRERERGVFGDRWVLQVTVPQPFQTAAPEVTTIEGEPRSLQVPAAC